MPTTPTARFSIISLRWKLPGDSQHPFEARRPWFQGLLVLASLSLIPGDAGAEPTKFTVDDERSYIAVRTDKGGLLSFFGAGHRHGIIVTKWSADICFDSQNVRASRVTVNVATPSLQIDTPDARKKTELDPGNGPSTQDVQEIQTKMLAPQNLAANEHPNITFASTSVQSSNEQSLLLRGSLTVRGITQPVSLPVSFEPLDRGRYHFEGEFPIKQTSYSIKPESVGGVVNVKDEVTVYLDIYTNATGQACQ